MKNTKLSPMAITSCTQLLLLVFASVTIMGVLVKAEVCSELVGSCEGIDCNQVCMTRHPGGTGSCDQTNSCNCFYQCTPPPPPKGRCNQGLGRCSSKCNQQCCAQNCASKHAGGIGICDDNLGPALALCQCQYPC